MKRYDIKKTWNQLSINIKVIIVLFILLVFIPIIIVNGGMQLFNLIYKITGWNISAYGLQNSEWFTFWGTYFGGIATVIAVWLTVRQTQKHYEQTSDEQKRQNKVAIIEQEKQRRLDVLPVLLLQPLLVKRDDDLDLALGILEPPLEPKQVFVDELKPSYEICSLSEITLTIGQKNIFRASELSEEERRRIRNKGEEDTFDGRTTNRSNPYVILFRPYWIINAGKETAINIILSLRQQNNLVSNLSTVISLMPREKLTFNLLVNVARKNLSQSIGEYLLRIEYYDIFENHYRQDFLIQIDRINDLANLKIGLEINQKLL
ncbi:MAG: hypothetical protein VB013_00975 [Anaerolineaceae bacterium]|nr:hypothetical protein [Anaerolineaceae bacterium]